MRLPNHAPPRRGAQSDAAECEEPRLGGSRCAGTLDDIGDTKEESTMWRSACRILLTCIAVGATIRVFGSSTDDEQAIRQLAQQCETAGIPTTWGYSAACGPAIATSLP
jgi:hypothetical protein